MSRLVPTWVLAVNLQWLVVLHAAFHGNCPFIVARCKSRKTGSTNNSYNRVFTG